MDLCDNFILGNIFLFFKKKWFLYFRLLIVVVIDVIYGLCDNIVLGKGFLFLVVCVIKIFVFIVERSVVLKGFKKVDFVVVGGLLGLIERLRMLILLRIVC